MRLALGTLAVAAFLTAAPMTQAAQRYAAPLGSGAACTLGSPCSLREAITRSSAGDEVIVTAGTYPVASTMLVPPGADGVHIHGDFGGAVPRLQAAITNAPILFAAAGGRLSFLEIFNSAASTPIGFVCPFQGSVDRVSATAIGDNAVAAEASGYGCPIRDSLLRAEGLAAIALSTGASSGFNAGSGANLTATAAGSLSVGIRAAYSGGTPGAFALALTNTIADGAMADLQASSGAFGPANIIVSNSNFDHTDEAGTASIFGFNNQTAPPLFVDAGNFRQAAGSPTIDAGTSDGIGPLDLDGHARVIGGAVDIGAYEHVPPPVVPGRLRWLKVRPRAFRPVNAGGATFSRTAKPRRSKIGATARYSLTRAATVRFFVQRKLAGRRVKGRCRKPTRANRKRRKCARWKSLKGGFRIEGTAGANRFGFTGRLRRKALRPGSYRLVGRASGTVRRAGFRIVR